MLIVRGFVRILLLGVCFICFCSTTIFGQEVIDKEYDLKAAYIYHFTKYIAWESEQASEEFVIGILGNTPIESLLKESLQQKKVCNQKVRIQRFSTVQAYNQAKVNCQILFVAKCMNNKVLNRFSLKSLENTLVIGEKQDFIENGGLVNFVIERNKLKFELNQMLMTALGFKVNSRLLRLAIINNNYGIQPDQESALVNCNL